ncbi:MAG: polyprenyl diphosphate synthase [Succinivibrio sp.]
MRQTLDNSGSLIPPRHLAIIMDGNGRWATSRGKQRVSGHREGANSVRRVIRACASLGVKELTLFAFSSENWKRPSLEVNALMTLFVQAIRKESKSLKENGIRTRIVGDKTRFPSVLQDQIEKLEELTADCELMQLNIAANYGGRWDIVQAASKLAKKCSEGQIDFNDLNEDLIKEHLTVVSDVDLMIRTGGEKRISNFLMWQAAYAELYFTDTLWPDFTEEDLQKAIEFYNSRERRFGMTSEQVKNKDNHNAD